MLFIRSSPTVNIFDAYCFDITQRERYPLPTLEDTLQRPLTFTRRQLAIPARDAGRAMRVAHPYIYYLTVIKYRTLRHALYCITREICT